ncbi:signal peptidase II [Brevundimonas sp.]|uniref:signal peptidase II n=1 Tax=Brevundimonas sp. TaxID=1871086 RepID=UPI002EDAC786
MSIRVTRLAVLAWGLALAVIVLDQLTKAWVVGSAGPGGIAQIPDGHLFGEVVPGLLRFTMVRNTGVSFGLFGGGAGRWVFSVFPFVVAAVMSWWALRVDRRLQVVAIGLIIGGAIGNAIDRIRFGYVVDFIDVSGSGVFPWVFNVADCGVNIGVALLLLDALWPEWKRRRGQAGSQGAAAT